MIDTLEFFEELKETFEAPAAEKLAKLMGKMYKELSNTVTKAEFEELTKAVKEIANRQEETNISLKELSEAQKKTEERLNQLAEAQKRTEERLEAFEKSTEENFNKVWNAINELTEAQKRTEERLNQLAEAQKRTEERLNQLAEAQKRTEETLNQLAKAHKETEEAFRAFEKSTTENFNKVWASIKELTESLKDTKELVGNLSDTVGYSLEDRAMKSLPQLLKERYGIVVTERLVRKYIKYNGKFDEVNIFGKGRKGNKTLFIIGEAKARLSKSHVDDLLKMIKRLEDKNFISGEKFLFIVTYTARPEAEEYCLKKGVEVIWSYDV